MNPEETGKRYDRLASLWQERMSGSDYGLSALRRAISFCTNRKGALDVGCGSEGRFLRVMDEAGFSPEGLDVSKEMIAQVKERNPATPFYQANIAEWALPKCYDLITAWDSTFHLPLAAQESVLVKLCKGLNPDGILLYTGGGGDEPDEISGTFDGETFHYSTLGVRRNLEVLAEQHLSVLHVEYDQGPEEKHVTFIARRKIVPSNLASAR